VLSRMSSRCQLSDEGKNLITSFGTLIDKLKMLMKSKTTFLATSSIKILEAISMLSNLGKNETHLLTENGKALPNLTSAFRKVVN
jgi:hypothetical protein